MVQYRLGVLGFMSTWQNGQVGMFGGNYGLLDQQLALEFIHRNAENLGGDPDRITIAGQSEGGSLRDHYFHQKSTVGHARFSTVRD